MGTFREYWCALTPEEKNSLAKDAETDKVYLSQIAHGHRNAGRNLIEKLVNVRPDSISYAMFFNSDAAA